jgi:hypothetical protein
MGCERPSGFGEEGVVGISSRGKCWSAIASLTRCAALALVTAAAVACSKGSDPVDDGSGGSVPGSVTDLAVTAVTPRTVSLDWTAPAGSDEDAGPAYAYDLRHAAAPITEAIWAEATEVPNEPAPLPPGMAQAMTISGLAPGTTYHFALKSGDSQGDWSALSNPAVATLPAETEVNFPDAVLDSLIRALIQKPSGPIYPDDIVGLLIIEAESLGIADLTSLAACTGVWRLNVAHNAISELTPLEGMAGLTTLVLAANQIAELAPVATLTGLTYLGIGTNQIDDLGPLAALPKLDALNAAENQIVDLSPLADLELLNYLYLNGNQIADLAPLVANAGLGEGDTIWLHWNPLSAEAINVQIPALQARGATVIW